MNTTDLNQAGSTHADLPKVFGIGLNKTGTKTLRRYLTQLGYRHRSYDSDNTHESPAYELWQARRIPELIDIMNDFDSCEDWPWPLVYEELDRRFDNAKFVLTTRQSPDAWYKSLCNMAVRIGPLPLFEAAVYGSAMPHGRKEEHLAFYHGHIQKVEEYFRDQPDKLLKLCWEDGDGPEKLVEFLGCGAVHLDSTHINRSPRNVYSGDSRVRAAFARLGYQKIYGPRAVPYRALGKIKGWLGGG